MVNKSGEITKGVGDADQLWSLSAESCVPGTSQDWLAQSLQQTDPHNLNALSDLVLSSQHTKPPYPWARTPPMTAATSRGKFASWPNGGGRASLCWGWITGSARSPSRTVSVGEAAGELGFEEAVDTGPEAESARESPSSSGAS